VGGIPRVVILLLQLLYIIFALASIPACFDTLLLEKTGWIFSQSPELHYYQPKGKKGKGVG
jgi:hypothetical protein